MFSETYGVTSYGSGWRRETYGITNYCSGWRRETYGITSYCSGWRGGTYDITNCCSGWRRETYDITNYCSGWRGETYWHNQLLQWLARENLWRNHSYSSGWRKDVVNQRLEFVGLVESPSSCPKACIITMVAFSVWALALLLVRIAQSCYLAGLEFSSGSVC